MATLTFKVTEEEARQIRAAARRQRLSISEFLRRQAQPHRRQSLEITRVVCGHTGATIFGPAPELAPLTTETVRGMLTEFP